MEVITFISVMSFVTSICAIGNNANRRRCLLVGIVTGFCLHMLYDYSIKIPLSNAIMKFESNSNGGLF